MANIGLSLVFVIYLVSLAYCDQCEYENQISAVDSLFPSCPKYFENASFSFCCVDFTTKVPFCCEEAEHTLLHGYSETTIACIVLGALLCIAVFFGIIYRIYRYNKQTCCGNGYGCGPTST